MTYIEKIKEKYPTWNDKKLDNFISRKCPMTVFGENRIAYCIEDPLMTCDRCWQQGYKE